MQFIRRGLKIDEAGARRSEERIEAVFEEVDAHLARGQKSLALSRFTCGRSDVRGAGGSDFDSSSIWLALAGACRNTRGVSEDRREAAETSGGCFWSSDLRAGAKRPTNGTSVAWRSRTTPRLADRDRSSTIPTPPRIRSRSSCPKRFQNRSRSRSIARRLVWQALRTCRPPKAFESRRSRPKRFARLHH